MSTLSNSGISHVKAAREIIVGIWVPYNGENGARDHLQIQLWQESTTYYRGKEVQKVPRKMNKAHLQSCIGYVDDKL